MRYVYLYLYTPQYYIQLFPNNNADKITDKTNTEDKSEKKCERTFYYLVCSHLSSDVNHHTPAL